MTWVRRGLLLGFMVFAGLLGWGWQQWSALHRPISEGPKQLSFEVQRGASLRKIVESIYEKGWVDSPWALEIYARRENLGRKLKAGSYLIDPQWTPATLLRKLEKGVLPPRVRVTFAEGLNRWEIAEKLEAAGLGESKAFLIEVEARQLEGRLFPDTYWFRKDAGINQVLETFTNRFEQALEKTYLKAESTSPWIKTIGSVENFLILASLVEKEAKDPLDQEKVARVFFNRLKLGMKLQTDPTCVYGPQLHTQKPHPRNCRDPRSKYSTYVIDGLPPTPIANPGESAMRAVLNPFSGTNADRLLYFVARRDGSGTHYFSSTLSEHRKAIDRYLRKVRPKKKRVSSP